MMEHIIPPSGSPHLGLSRRLSPRRDCRHRFTMPPPAANGGGGCHSERSFSTPWYPWSANRLTLPPSPLLPTSSCRGLTPTKNTLVEYLTIFALGSECDSLRVHRASFDPEQTRPVPALRRKQHGQGIIENA